MLAKLLSTLKGLIATAAIVQALRWAHDFRLHAIRNFGTVIHEFGLPCHRSHAAAYASG